MTIRIPDDAHLLGGHRHPGASGLAHRTPLGRHRRALICARRFRVRADKTCHFRALYRATSARWLNRAAEIRRAATIRSIHGLCVDVYTPEDR